MENFKDKHIKRAQELIDFSTLIKNNCDNPDGECPGETYYEWKSSCKVFLEKTVGKNSDFYQDFVGVSRDATRSYHGAAGIGILNALKKEIESGLFIKL